jgi:hypothetical protein
VLYLFGDGSHANKRGAKNPGGTERAHQPASSVVFWPALRIVDGSVGWLSRVSRLSHHLPKRHTAYRTENALFRGMVGEFTPPRWAKLVIVGGDSAYSSKDDMRMVQDRDKAALSRRWGFVFAIARTWKHVEDGREENDQTARDACASPVLPMHTSSQRAHRQRAARSFGRIRFVYVCVMLGKSLWC